MSGCRSIYPSPFDAVILESRDRLEASAYTLLVVRRALLEPVVGVADTLIWTTPSSVRERRWPSMGTVLAAAAAREECRLWPVDLPLPGSFAAETLVQLLYTLARRRAVTEELLMNRNDADLARPHRTTVHSDLLLGDVMRALATRELQDAAVLRALRSQLQPRPPAVEGDGVVVVRLQPERLDALLSGRTKGIPSLGTAPG